ncbi:MAG: hypothetical protein DHS20C08_21970 [Rhodomicrobium sp.]|nr:MAG: hypothetical protein DHS20C08_21970 [Rhodomicrobium sp.]
MTLIYKIAEQADWALAIAEGRYNGSADDLRDGFIHFSTEEQLQATLNKHYQGKSNLLLIAIDAETLGPDLKWEPSRGGALFPHLYAPLPTAAISWEKPIEKNQAGENISPL